MNIRNGNTFYIDTQHSVATDDLTIKGVRVPFIFYTSSSAINMVVLSDVNGDTKLRFNDIVNQGLVGDTRLYDFSANPILFPNGIKVSTLTNAIITCVIIDPRG